jgi:hypothetical protein
MHYMKMNAAAPEGRPGGGSMKGLLIAVIFQSFLNHRSTE